MGLASDPDADRAAGAWLECQTTGVDPYDWVEELTLDWIRFGNVAAMWYFVLKLCEAVDEDCETIGQIAAGPLYDMIRTWPDATLTLVEAEAGANPTLLGALSGVITSNPTVRQRIDAILA